MAPRGEAHALHESVPLTDGDGEDPLPPTPNVERKNRAMPFVLALSCLLNVILGTILLTSFLFNEAPQAQSKYAGLKRDVMVPYHTHTEYGLKSESDAARSELWERLDASTGEISLDNAEARAFGLPESTPFFWDERRSIYLLNAHHSLHCLRKLHRWVTIAQHNGTQLDAYPHLVHCLDHLLQGVRCAADDTPLYTASHSPDSPTGEGQLRACRSWEALDAWARERTACFAYVNETQGVGGEQLLRFRYCPRGSPYLDAMRATFGYTDDWWKAAPADVDTVPRYWANFR